MSHMAGRSQSSGRHLRCVSVCDIHMIMMLLNRLFITRSTPLLVMCGAMESFSMRYGVWDISPMRIMQTVR